MVSSLLHMILGFQKFKRQISVLSSHKLMKLLVTVM